MCAAARVSTCVQCLRGSLRVGLCVSPCQHLRVHTCTHPHTRVWSACGSPCTARPCRCCRHERPCVRVRVGARGSGGGGGGGCGEAEPSRAGGGRPAGPHLAWPRGGTESGQVKASRAAPRARTRETVLWSPGQGRPRGPAGHHEAASALGRSSGPGRAGAEHPPGLFPTQPGGLSVNSA